MKLRSKITILCGGTVLLVLLLGDLLVGNLLIRNIRQFRSNSGSYGIFVR